MANLAVIHNSLKRSSLVPPRPVQLSDGEYKASLKAWTINTMPGEKRKGYVKLEMHWQVVTEGSDKNVILRSFHNVALTHNKQISVGWSSKLARDYASVYGYPAKATDIHPDNLEGRLLKVRVRTITQDRNRKSLNVNARYSVVDGLLELIAGGNPNA